MADKQPIDIQSLTCEELCSHLKDISIDEDVINKFKKEKISGASLPLTKEELRELVPLMGPRKILMRIPGILENEYGDNSLLSMDSSTPSIDIDDIKEEKQGAGAMTGPSDSTPRKGKKTLDKLKKLRSEGSDEYYQVEAYCLKKKSDREFSITESQAKETTAYDDLLLPNPPGNSEVDYSKGTIWKMKLRWNLETKVFEASNEFKPIMKE